MLLTIPTVSNFFNTFSLEIGSMIISGVHFIIAFFEFFSGMLIVNCKNDSEMDCVTKRVITETGIALSAIEMAANIVLFVGAFRQDAASLVLWLITYVIAIIAAILFYLIVGVLVEWSETALILYICFIFISLSLFVYMWIVVYSHYVVLKEENARGQYDKQAYRAT